MKIKLKTIISIISLVLPILSYGQATRVTLSQLAQSGATDGQFIKWNNSTLNWEAGTVTSSGGTVTSVGLSLPSIFTVTVSPITSSGTLTATLANQNANVVFAGPSTGAAAAPTFRSLVAADIPALPYVPTSRTLTINGTALDLSANRSWSVGTVTSVAALTLGTTGTDVSSSVANGSTTPVITLNIPTASATNRGALSSTDWTTFNNKQSAISLTTTGSSGSATFISNVLNVPTYTLAGLGGISLTSLSATAPLSYNNTTGAFSITQSSSATSGFLSSTDWVTFNNKQSTITLTTTGTSGAATFSANTLNIPQYQAAGSYVPTTRTLTINGTAADLSADRSWSVGTVTQLSAAIGTTGTDIGYTISNATTTPLLTINIPTASSSARGALSNTDWSTFNNKQSAITLTTTGNSGAATFTSNTLNIPNYTLTGLGGFANPMTTLGDLIYGGTSGAPTRLAGNTAAATYYLAQTGTGTASNIPTWKSISGNEISGAALTKTDDTNVTLTLGGLASTALLRAASLTLGWTGQLSVSRGGTGLSSLGTANQYLRVNSGATALEYATFPTIITDHGALTGLADDDHTQYAILSGRGTGQTLQGGTSGSATLQLSSTSNASKGRIHLAYDGGDVWIGGAATASTLRLYSANATNYTGLVAGAQSSDITYTLPITGGTAGQFLSTNGSGTLSWATGATISGTASRIPYYNTSSSLASSGLTWDNTNSRLGINVISPSATLQVGGTSDNSGTYSLYITNQAGDKVLNFDNSGKVGINVSNPATTLHFNGSMSRKAPVRTGVATAYTVLDDDSWIIVNNASSTVTLTLPAASSFQGRELMIKNVSAIAVNSTSSVPVIAINTNPGSNPPTTTTSILPATAGKWATLVSIQGGDSNWYWAIMQAN